MVDEDLREHPAVVVAALPPLRDIFVLYLLGLLAHPRLLLTSAVFFYPEEAPCIPHRGALSTFSTECVEEVSSEGSQVVPASSLAEVLCDF
jgi:hypothetical protein